MATRLLIEGRVQGVGYRAWLRGDATRRGLSGWCRNLADGRVEAVVAGDGAEIAALVAACRRGPPAAQVTDVAVADADDPGITYFGIRHTA